MTRLQKLEHAYDVLDDAWRSMSEKDYTTYLVMQSLEKLEEAIKRLRHPPTMPEEQQS